jgi:hypothetical protein
MFPIISPLFSSGTFQRQRQRQGVNQGIPFQQQGQGQGSGIPFQGQSQGSGIPFQGQSQGQSQGVGFLPQQLQAQGQFPAVTQPFPNPGPFPTPDPTAYIFTQILPAAVWTINHNLATFPSVTLVDQLGNTIMAQVQYASSNQIVVTFSQPMAGNAFLNV